MTLRGLPGLVAVLACMPACAAVGEIQIADAGPEASAQDAQADAETLVDATAPQDASAPPDAAPDAATDWRDAIAASFPDSVTAAVTNSNGAPSLDCLGTWDFTDDPTTSNVFLTFSRGTGADQMRYFPNGVMPPAGTCSGATCRSLTFNEETATASTSQSRRSPFGYLISPADETYVGTQWSMLSIANYSIEPDVTAYNVGSVAPATRLWFDGALAQFGSAPTPTPAIVGIFFIDCERNVTLGNAVLRIVRENGTPLGFGINGNAWQGIRYPRGLLSDWSAAETTASVVNGAFEAGNMPIADATNGELYRFEIWGRVEENGEPRLLGCEAARVVPNTVTYMIMQPKRTGSPSSCSE